MSSVVRSPHVYNRSLIGQTLILMSQLFLSVFLVMIGQALVKLELELLLMVLLMGAIVGLVIMMVVLMMLMIRMVMVLVVMVVMAEMGRRGPRGGGGGPRGRRGPRRAGLVPPAVGQDRPAPLGRQRRRRQEVAVGGLLRFRSSSGRRRRGMGRHRGPGPEAQDVVDGMGFQDCAGAASGAFGASGQSVLVPFGQRVRPD